MIDFKEINHNGIKFMIPCRDSESEWQMQIAIWLNSNAGQEAVQDSIYVCAEMETEDYRAKELKKLLDDDTGD